MFSHLIESTSHQQELARKGRFFLATLAGYALMVSCAGVASIYAYDAHLENQNLELVTLVSPIQQPEQPSPLERAARPRAAANAGESNASAKRTELIERVESATKIPKEVSAVKSNAPPIPKSGGVELGTSNSEATSIGGPTGPGTPNGEQGGSNGSLVKIETPPPALKEKPAAPATPKIIKTSKVLNGQATYLPKPAYPNLARQIRASGAVNVQILIDEAGRVVSARATSGHPTLHEAAVQAALQARFSPTRLNETPVKVSGIITYNFIMQ